MPRTLAGVENSYKLLILGFVRRWVRVPYDHRVVEKLMAFPIVGTGN